VYDMKCLTRFAVFSKKYEEVLAGEVADEELVGEPAWYSPNDLVRLQLRKPQDNKPITDPYNPLFHTPNLYLDIAKINNSKDLIKFTNTYGLPSGRAEINKTDLDETVTLIEMETFYFFEELEEYQNLLNLWYEILHKEQVSQYPSFLVNGEFISNKEKESSEVIAKMLNHKKSWKESIENLGGLDGVSLCVRFRTLFEVAYFQLTNAVLNRKSLRRCMECNSIFEVNHESQKFCPPKIGVKRSTCENTHKVRKRRQKQKENPTN
jgi:hypothetical protein